MATRCAIYCRLSQDRTGAGVVVERQERDCRELATARGWEIVAVFVDNDVSAYRKKARPGYQALLQALEAGTVTAVVVWHADRLHRSPVELEGYISICERKEIATATVRAGELDLTTASGRMVARQLGAVARYESDQTAGRTKAGKVDAAARGAFNGGPAPFGFRFVPEGQRQPSGEALAVEPDQAQVLRSTAASVLAGASLRSCALELNRAGKRTARGNPWTPSALRKTLTAPVVAGFRASKGEVLTKGAWPAILDEPTWRGLLAVLGDPARRTTEQRARRYLGSGLYRCGVCGGTLTGNPTAGGSKGERRTAYRCRVADMEVGRTHVVRDADRLDRFVEDLVIHRLCEPDALESLTAPRDDGLMQALITERSALVAQEKALGRSWAKGLAKNTLLAAAKAIADRLVEIDATIGGLSAGPVLDGLTGGDLDHTRTVWHSLNLERRRAVVGYLLSVTVKPVGRRGRLPNALEGFDPDGVKVDWNHGVDPNAAIAVDLS